jgi:hypothetical protein
MKTQNAEMNYHIHVQGSLGKNAVISYDGFDADHTANCEEMLCGSS